MRAINKNRVNQKNKKNKHMSRRQRTKKWLIELIKCMMLPKYNKIRFISADRKFRRSCPNKKRNSSKQLKQKKRSSKIKTYLKVIKTLIKNSLRKNKAIEEVKMSK